MTMSANLLDFLYPSTSISLLRCHKSAGNAPRMHETLGQRVRRLREARGMSQDDLAERSGVSQQAISQLEDDIVKQPRRIIEIAGALGISPEALKSGVGHRSQNIDVKLLLGCLQAARAAAADNIPPERIPDERGMLEIAAAMYQKAFAKEGANLYELALAELLRFHANNPTR